jgi:hypothetical protein
MPSFVMKFNKHRLRKNNGIVGVMYELYLDGRSLAEIAKIYGKTRQAVYDVFRSRGYKLRSKPLRGLTIIDGYRFTEMKGGYLRGTVGNRRILAHQYVWEKTNGPLPEDTVLHFKDGDPQHVAIDNLEVVPKPQMAAKFNPERKGCWGRDDAPKRLSLREKVRRKREERWKRAMAIG